MNEADKKLALDWIDRICTRVENDGGPIYISSWGPPMPGQEDRAGALDLLYEAAWKVATAKEVLPC